MLRGCTPRFRILISVVFVSWLLASPALARGHRVVVQDDEGAPVEFAVISLYWVGDMPPPAVAGETHPAAMDQRNEEFVPHVLAVQRGTQVLFPNSDRVRHHVYSFSPAKRFELKLYSGLPPRTIDFDTSGEVVLGCNIHDHMLGYIYVVDTPHFAVTGPSGEVTLQNLADGPYEIRVWHPRLEHPVDPRRVEIGSDAPVADTLRVSLKTLAPAGPPMPAKPAR